MTDSPKADVERVVADFEKLQDLLSMFCDRTGRLIEACLQDANIRYQSLQFRVKTKEKLRQKYLDSSKNYKRLDDITDLAGLRIVTYYEDDVDRVASVIEREFEIDRQNSIDKRKAEPDRFGYNALNYVCSHNEKRTSDVEYKKFASLRCEIQITSILRHAWSEMEHEWYDLKDAYPEVVKRRFYRLAALLEIAESDFLDIRNTRVQYEKSVAVRVLTNVPDVPIDVVSLQSFIDQDALVADIDEKLAKSAGLTLTSASLRWLENRSQEAAMLGVRKLNELRDLLNRYNTAIPEYFRRMMGLWPASPSSTMLKGASVYHLFIFLLCIRDEKAAITHIKQGQQTLSWDVAKQIEIAQEVVAKYAPQK